ncbi:MAG: ATP-binding protein, partial [Acidobacteriota bacterium]
AAGAAALAAHLSWTGWQAFLVVLAAGLAMGAWWVSWAIQPTVRLLQALRGGVDALRAGDHSLRLTEDRRDELGDLVSLYNELATVLGRERSDLRQRELLLHAALETSPAAVLLINSVRRVVLGNRAARQLFTYGHRLDGRSWDDLLAACPESMREALENASDALVSHVLDGNEETFQMSRRVFDLNARRHVLIVVRHLTSELRRQEAATWRKVLRVIGHEIHNSLAPIRSLAHSARQLRRRDPGDPRLDEILASVEDSADSLHRFVDGYRHYARLPEPRLQTVDLRSFFTDLQRSDPFRLVREVPARTVEVDPGQLRQVLHNLLKNAREAGSPPEEIEVEVMELAGGDLAIRVLDRGEGMDEERLAQAPLPFFSSKAEGTGLGLALCREILEAHGGHLDLALRPGGGVAATYRLPG